MKRLTLRLALLTMLLLALVGTTRVSQAQGGRCSLACVELPGCPAGWQSDAACITECCELSGGGLAFCECAQSCFYCPWGDDTSKK